MVIGAGKLGAQVLRQLRKNPDLEVVVADPHDRPLAVAEGLVEKVDLKTHVTALNFQEVVDAVNPDLVLLARTTEDWEKVDTPMGPQYVLGMERELTKSAVAVLPVCEDAMGSH